MVSAKRVSLPGPAQTEREIWRRWSGPKPSESYISNPKSTVVALFGQRTPDYRSAQVDVNGMAVFRCVGP